MRLDDGDQFLPIFREIVQRRSTYIGDLRISFQKKTKSFGYLIEKRKKKKTSELCSSVEQGRGCDQPFISFLKRLLSVCNYSVSARDKMD